MDIKVTLKIEGLEPLASAITNLATAYSNSGTAAAAVIEKAKGGKAKADPKPVDTQAASATEATTESQAPAANETAQESPSEGKTNGQQASAASAGSVSSESTKTETAAQSTESSAAQNQKTISDEDLRVAAGQAAKRDKEKVKALVAKYAPNVSAIAAEDRPTFLKELEAV